MHPTHRVAVGTPPPVRGHSPWHLARFAIACRASAIILDLHRHPAEAAALRRLAEVAETQARGRGPARPEGIAA